MTQTIINQATELLTEQFTNGEGLRGVPLKNYSGPKLEEWSEDVLRSLLRTYRKSILTLVLSMVKVILNQIMKDLVMRD